MKKFKTLLIIACGLSIGLSGCCNKYKEQIAGQKDEISKLQINIDELNQAKSALETAVADYEKAKAELEHAVAAHVAYQQALEAEIEKLGGDKAAMSAKFKDAQKDLAAQQKTINEMRKKEAMAKKRLATLKDMLSKFKTLIEGGKLKVKIRNGKLMLELPSAILFDSGKAKLSEEGQETLTEVAGVLAKISHREFQVAGHTDNVPMKSGKFPSNWELSTARAVSVVRFLQEEGVNPKNLSASGYSEYMPAVKNNSKENKALNRRIEIVLMPNLDELPDLSSLEKEIN